MKNSFVIPCNPKVYDVVKHFEKNETICWKRGASEKNGDDVYVYIGVPVKAIKYKCIVENDNVNKDELKDYTYATKGNGMSCRYMMLRKIYEYKEPINLETIKTLGIYMIRKQTKADRELLLHLIMEERKQGK